MKKGYNRKHFVFIRNPRKQKVGVVYIITHPLYKGWIKIGYAKNIKTRIVNYNIHDPLKRYQLYFHIQSNHCNELESLVFDILRCLGYTQRGEWILCNPDVAKCILSTINFHSTKIEEVSYQQRFDELMSHVCEELKIPILTTFTENRQKEIQLNIQKRNEKVRRDREKVFNLWNQLK